ncbi:MAG: peptidoglycan DD-metalloendopeptidase family protein [Bacteroidales bacterium]|jgi:septal ring factor EnvC (AmiA/AmiB activator)|nr:peptidoglycan DD-metalloendopeptidase family protein [Bacteroidales bacterium]
MIWQKSYRYFIKSALAIGFLFLTLNGFSQTRTELDTQIVQLEKEIAYTNELLNTTLKSRDDSYYKIELIARQITRHEKVLASIQKEIDNINSDIEFKQLEIRKKEAELSTLKSEYAKMIYFANRNRGNYDKLMFIFASKDFNQAYKRLKYFEQYSHYRKNQVNLINESQQVLDAAIKQLEKDRTEKLSLRLQETQTKEKLNQQKIEQQRGLNRLKSKEKGLKSDLRKKARQKSALKKAIEKLIASEAEKIKKFALTPEEIAISDNFENNQGKLPWPVERGVLFSSFGEHAHPYIKRIKIRNDGIDIATDEGSQARAVFDGEVRSIISVPGTPNYAILIKHGNYFTLYSNISKAIVSPGQKVKARQNLGVIYKEPSDQSTKLQFQLWKNTSKMNPINWLSR